ncbi:MAG: winged helix family transcriptional regulator, partial [Actinobacteria bacterium]|nr:winged helix family transcriptional regulator [Actinomycetota bacterium]
GWAIYPIGFLLPLAGTGAFDGLVSGAVARFEGLEVLALNRLPNGQSGIAVALLDPASRGHFTADEIDLNLLELLIRNAGIVLDHSTIYERIWKYDFGPDSKNLAVYIGYLRRKTEEGGGSRLIHTVRGVGYSARVER